MRVQQGDWDAVDKRWGDLLEACHERLKGDWEIKGDCLVPCDRPAIESLVDARRFKRPEFWEYLRRADLLAGREVKVGITDKIRFGQSDGGKRGKV